MAALTTTDVRSRVTAAFNALRIIDRPTSTAQEVAEALAGDPLLNKQLMKMARSPLAGIRNPDLTADRAVVLLGFISVRKLAVMNLCRQLSDAAPESDSMDRWARALWKGIASEQVAMRLQEALASDALMNGILDSFAEDVEAAGLDVEGSEGPANGRLAQILRSGDAIADCILGSLPGLPSTSMVDDCLEQVGLPRLGDGRLAIDIRRGFDLYASIFG